MNKKIFLFVIFCLSTYQSNAFPFFPNEISVPLELKEKLSKNRIYYKKFIVVKNAYYLDVQGTSITNLGQLMNLLFNKNSDESTNLFINTNKYYLALNICNTSVKDLTPLKGFPIKGLWLEHTPVDDLKPIQGMKITDLAIKRTEITDISPLMGMPLEQIRLNPYLITNGWNALRHNSSLKNINRMTKEVFFEKYDCNVWTNSILK
jgi:hypothetical protein